MMMQMPARRTADSTALIGSEKQVAWAESTALRRNAASGWNRRTSPANYQAPQERPASIMQTFLPLPSFAESASVLDYRRLGKQRVECAQLLNALRGGKGWSSHPACRMWRGYEAALSAYMDECILEWVRRGYRNNMPLSMVHTYTLPPWFGNAAFHAAHRSNLIRKDPAYYGQFGWTESDDLPYVWPLIDGFNTGKGL